jgi:malic enzyme
VAVYEAAIWVATRIPSVPYVLGDRRNFLFACMVKGVKSTFGAFMLQYIDMQACFHISIL